MRPAVLGVTLREILEGTDTLAQHGATLDPYVRGAHTPVDLAREAEWAFQVLSPSLVAPTRAAALRDAITAAGRVRRVLQHGDLWPMNITRYDGHWWLLDFEIFGRIQAPMYDAFHLIRSCWSLRQGRLQRIVQRARRIFAGANGTPNWIESLRSSRAPEPYRRTLAWARDRNGLTNTEAIGALAFYLIDITARMYRRKVVMGYVQPYLNEVAALADALMAGETFADALGDQRS
jgi:hypothetical protein